MIYEPIQVESAVCDDLCLYLYELAKKMDSIVELGSFYGKSTHALLSACPGIVFAVDHFLGSADRSDGTYGRSGKEAFFMNCGHFENLRVLEMTTKEASFIFEPKSVDMVFIDAGHLYEEFLDDLTNWLPKVRKVICGHDIVYPSVRKVLADLNVNYTRPCENYWEYKLCEI